MNLKNQIVEIPGVCREKFEINTFKKECILNGVDEVEYLVNLKPEIKKFEQNLIK